MRSRRFFTIVMTALLTLSVAHAQVFTCTFNKGISVKINDHFDSDPTTPNHNAINYVHYMSGRSRPDGSGNRLGESEPHDHSELPLPAR